MVGVWFFRFNFFLFGLIFLGPVIALDSDRFSSIIFATHLITFSFKYIERKKKPNLNFTLLGGHGGGVSLSA